MVQRGWRSMALVGAAFLGMSAGAQGVVIGDFEGTLADANVAGWGEWGTPNAGYNNAFSGIFSISNSGATLGSQSLLITQAGWDQNLAYSASVAGTIPQFVANDVVLIDVTFPASQVDGWAQVFEIALNSEGGGFEGRNYAGQGAGWGPGGGAAQTITLEFDYSNHKAAWPVGGPGWIELIFATNSDANHGFFHFDNIRLAQVPEPAAMGVMALAGGALLRRRRSHR